ncbi:outer membrane protein assembly factor BamC [Marinobacterium alkalitolerans]|nr:outer membrane protein assembly factor BamC [Marinobacterium alkalitolerans]
MLRTRYLPLAVAVSVALGGCSVVENNPIYGDNGVIRDRSQDYELAQKSERLQLPPHLRAKEMQEQLVVPDAGVTAVSSDAFEVPRPEFFYAESGSESVNLRRMDGEKVILVDEPIADVWRKARDFWAFNDIDIAYSDPRQGVLETDWIELDGHDYSFIDLWVKRLTLQDVDGPTRNKLRMTVRPDPDDYNRTAIRLSHVQFPLDAKVADVDWQSQSRDVEYKSDMMFEMLRYLSKAGATPSANSLLAMQQKQKARPQLGRDSRGNPVLKISEHADQAWQMVNDALDLAEIDAGTRDQSRGIIYLTYTTTTPFDSTEKMGFFEWLHSDRDEIKLETDFLSNALGGDSSKDEISYSSSGSNVSEAAAGEDVIESDLADPNNPANQPGYKIWFGGKVIYVFGSNKNSSYNAETGNLEHTGRYQLHLNRTRNGVFLSVHTQQGLEAPAIVAEEILWAIKDQLPEPG